MKAKIPLEAKKVFDTLQQNGARIYIVGGFVRDYFLGNKAQKIDIDVEVHQITALKLIEVLSQFGKVDCIGQQFGIYKLKSIPYIDFSLPRIDNLIGKSHRDFNVTIDPNLSIEQTMKRRDFRCNSIYYDVQENQFIDDHQGIDDIKNKIINVVDKKSFSEDPLRMLRMIQMVSRFDFKVSDECLRMCQEMVDALQYLSHERIEAEMNKFIDGKNRSLGLYYLEQLNIIKPKFLFDRKLFNQISDSKICFSYIKQAYEINCNFKFLNKYKMELKIKEDDINSYQNYMIFLKKLNHKINKEDLKIGIEIFYPELIQKYDQIVKQYGSEFKAPIVNGSDLIDWGLKPNQLFTLYLQQAYYMQLSGMNKEQIKEKLKEENK